MTENEKAATFIGPVCDGEVVYVRTRGWFKCRKCKLEDIARAEWVHKVPDMSLPANYMKALDALVAKYGAIQLTLTHHAIGLSTPGFAHHVVENEWPQTLAALYDAEHPKEQS